MCVGEPIKYTIKIKSHLAELYSLKKINFFRLAVLFPDEIECFLKLALLKYNDFERNYNNEIKHYFETQIKIRKTLIMRAPNFQQKGKCYSSKSVFSYEGDVENRNSFSRKRFNGLDTKENNEINQYAEMIKNLLLKNKKKYSQKFIDTIFTLLNTLILEKNHDNQIKLSQKIEHLLIQCKKLIIEV